MLGQFDFLGVNGLEEEETIETSPEDDEEFFQAVKEDWTSVADPTARQAFDNDIATYDCEEKEWSCVPEKGTCRPQCPQAWWDYDRR